MPSGNGEKPKEFEKYLQEFEKYLQEFEKSLGSDYGAYCEFKLAQTPFARKMELWSEVAEFIGRVNVDETNEKIRKLHAALDDHQMRDLFGITSDDATSVKTRFPLVTNETGEQLIESLLTNIEAEVKTAEDFMGEIVSEKLDLEGCKRKIAGLLDLQKQISSFGDELDSLNLPSALSQLADPSKLDEEIRKNELQIEELQTPIQEATRLITEHEKKIKELEGRALNTQRAKDALVSSDTKIPGLDGELSEIRNSLATAKEELKKQKKIKTQAEQEITPLRAGIEQLKLQKGLGNTFEPRIAKQKENLKTCLTNIANKIDGLKDDIARKLIEPLEAKLPEYQKKFGDLVKQIPNITEITALAKAQDIHGEYQRLQQQITSCKAAIASELVTLSPKPNMIESPLRNLSKTTKVSRSDAASAREQLFSTNGVESNLSSAEADEDGDIDETTLTDYDFSELESASALKTLILSPSLSPGEYNSGFRAYVENIITTKFITPLSEALKVKSAQSADADVILSPNDGMFEEIPEAFNKLLEQLESQLDIVYQAAQRKKKEIHAAKMREISTCIAEFLEKLESRKLGNLSAVRGPDENGDELAAKAQAVIDAVSAVVGNENEACDEPFGDAQGKVDRLLKSLALQVADSEKSLSSSENLVNTVGTLEQVLTDRVNAILQGQEIEIYEKIHGIISGKSNNLNDAVERFLADPLALNNEFHSLDPTQGDQEPATITPDESLKKIEDEKKRINKNFNSADDFGENNRLDTVSYQGEIIKYLDEIIAGLDGEISALGTDADDSVQRKQWLEEEKQKFESLRAVIEAELKKLNDFNLTPTAAKSYNAIEVAKMRLNAFNDVFSKLSKNTAPNADTTQLRAEVSELEKEIESTQGSLTGAIGNVKSESQQAKQANNPAATFLASVLTDAESVSKGFEELARKVAELSVQLKPEPANEEPPVDVAEPTPSAVLGDASDSGTVSDTGSVKLELDETGTGSDISPPAGSEKESEGEHAARFSVPDLLDNTGKMTTLGEAQLKQAQAKWELAKNKDRLNEILRYRNDLRNLLEAARQAQQALSAELKEESINPTELQKKVVAYVNAMQEVYEPVNNGECDRKIAALEEIKQALQALATANQGNADLLRQITEGLENYLTSAKRHLEGFATEIGQIKNQHIADLNAYLKELEQKTDAKKLCDDANMAYTAAYHGPTFKSERAKLTLDDSLEKPDLNVDELLEYSDGYLAIYGTCCQPNIPLLEDKHQAVEVGQREIQALIEPLTKGGTTEEFQQFSNVEGLNGVSAQLTDNLEIIEREQGNLKIAQARIPELAKEQSRRISNLEASLAKGGEKRQEIEAEIDSIVTAFAAVKPDFMPTNTEDSLLKQATSKLEQEHKKALERFDPLLLELSTHKEIAKGLGNPGNLTKHSNELRELGNIADTLQEKYKLTLAHINALEEKIKQAKRQLGSDYHDKEVQIDTLWRAQQTETANKGVPANSSISASYRKPSKFPVDPGTPAPELTTSSEDEQETANLDPETAEVSQPVTPSSHTPGDVTSPLESSGTESEIDADETDHFVPTNSDPDIFLLISEDLLELGVDDTEDLQQNDLAWQMKSKLLAYRFRSSKDLLEITNRVNEALADPSDEEEGRSPLEISRKMRAQLSELEKIKIEGYHFQNPQAGELAREQAIEAAKKLLTASTNPQETGLREAIQGFNKHIRAHMSTIDKYYARLTNRKNEIDKELQSMLAIAKKYVDKSAAKVKAVIEAAPAPDTDLTAQIAAWANFKQKAANLLTPVNDTSLAPEVFITKAKELSEIASTVGFSYHQEFSICAEAVQADIDNLAKKEKEAYDALRAAIEAEKKARKEAFERLKAESGDVQEPLSLELARLSMIREKIVDGAIQAEKYSHDHAQADAFKKDKEDFISLGKQILVEKRKRKEKQEQERQEQASLAASSPGSSSVPSASVSDDGAGNKDLDTTSKGEQAQPPTAGMQDKFKLRRLAATEYKALSENADENKRIKQEYAKKSGALPTKLFEIKFLTNNLIGFSEDEKRKLFSDGIHYASESGYRYHLKATETTPGTATLTAMVHEDDLVAVDGEDDIAHKQRVMISGMQIAASIIANYTKITFFGDDPLVIAAGIVFVERTQELTGQKFEICIQKSEHDKNQISLEKFKGDHATNMEDAREFQNTLATAAAPDAGAEGSAGASNFKFFTQVKDIHGKKSAGGKAEVVEDDDAADRNELLPNKH